MRTQRSPVCGTWLCVSPTGARDMRARVKGQTCGECVWDRAITRGPWCVPECNAHCRCGWGRSATLPANLNSPVLSIPIAPPQASPREKEESRVSSLTNRNEPKRRVRQNSPGPVQTQYGPSGGHPGPEDLRPNLPNMPKKVLLKVQCSNKRWRERTCWRLRS